MQSDWTRNWENSKTESKWFLEKTIHNIEVTFFFVDFAKTFDSIHRGKLEQILLAYGLPKETVTGIMNVQVHLPDRDTNLPCPSRLLKPKIPCSEKTPSYPWHQTTTKCCRYAMRELPLLTHELFFERDWFCWTFGDKFVTTKWNTLYLKVPLQSIIRYFIVTVAEGIFLWRVIWFDT